MLIRLFTWLRNRYSPEDYDITPPERPPAPSRVSAVPVRPKPVARPKPKPKKKIELSDDPGGAIEDGGPGKNVFIRNKYVREDTGTHETLKILDDSLLDSQEEPGMDPYNTGRFDRSKSWQFRSRK